MVFNISWHFLFLSFSFSFFKHIIIVLCNFYLHHMYVLARERIENQLRNKSV